jgi:hypothetical protein
MSTLRSKIWNLLSKPDYTLDLATLLAIVIAIGSLWVYIHRFEEEMDKTRVTTRVAQLETKALDQLFHFRERLYNSLDRFDDLPDISDNTTAKAFATMLRSIRHDVRKSIDEYALFGTSEEYQKHLKAFSEAKKAYDAFFQGLQSKRVDYKLANRFKAPLYLLLEDADIRILEIQEIDGKSRAPEKAAVRSKYQTFRNEIDELERQPNQWTRVKRPPN